MKILAVDPGWTTGIAIEADDGSIHTSLVQSMEQLIDEILTIAEWDHIVCERFTTDYMIHKAGLDTLQLIGAVRAYAYINKIPLHLQMPQFRYSSKEEMQLVLKGRKTVIHERDAVMHLLAFKEKTLCRLVTS